MTLRLASELASDPQLTQPPRVLVPPVGVEGRIALMYMPPKGGKSTTAAGMLAKGSREGITCALLSLDEHKGDSLQRLERFGADLGRVYVDDTFAPKTLRNELLRHNVQFLVVDHIGVLAELNPYFADKSQGDGVLWGRLLRPFVAMAHHDNIGVVLLDQARKSDGDYSGAAAKAGAVDYLVKLVADRGGIRSVIKGRHPLADFEVRLDPQGIPVFTPLTGGGRVEAAQPRTVTGVTRTQRDILQALCTSGDLRAGEWQRVAKDQFGVSRSRFYEVQPRLVGGGHVELNGKHYTVTASGTQWLEGLPG